MNNNVIQPEPVEPQQPRNAANWTQQQTRTLRIEQTPEGALSINNVHGRQIASPLNGFGQMWQKTYSVRLEGLKIEPTVVIKTWKENFGSFWPENSRFFASITGIAPGEIAVLNLAVGGLPLSTGVLVLYADDESFTLMTPQGHMFAGWITFSSYKDEDTTIVHAQVLMRASDPIYEIGLQFGGHKQEDIFWQKTLSALACYLGASRTPDQVEIEAICLDKKRQWSYIGNTWHNSAVRTLIHTLVHPNLWLQRKPNREKPSDR